MQQATKSVAVVKNRLFCDGVFSGNVRANSIGTYKLARFLTVSELANLEALRDSLADGHETYQTRWGNIAKKR